jgi:hypothetical protein
VTNLTPPGSECNPTERETIAEREKVEAEMDAEWERREAQKARRAEESRKLVELEVKREEEMAFVEASHVASDVDTDDDIDEAAEFDSWRGAVQVCGGTIKSFCYSAQRDN